ncbi:PAS domain-containing protein [Methylobacterium nigriterrae]|uniref:PAS domain-containing protein n=1 Tax=Methylobacterium nigriterrae TaxID=3127512 RepID=UPI003013D5F8
MNGRFLTFSSREFLRMIEVQGLTGTWSWIFATGEQTWSQGFYDILGLERAAVPPSYARLRDQAHPEDRPNLEDPLEVARVGTLADCTFRIIRPDGAMRILMTRSEIFHAPDGRPISAAGVVLDVTDHERLTRLQAAEQRRREALARQARVFTFTEVAVPFVEYGPELLAMTGLRRENLIENWSALTVPEEWDHWHAQIPALYATGKAYSVTPTLRLAGGGRGRFRFTLVPTRNAAAIESWTMVIVPVDTVTARATGDLRRGLEQGIEGHHLRAGRALLDWSMTDLARASGLSFSTIRRLEENAEGPAARSRHAAVAALRTAGICFSLIEGDAIALSLAG